MAEKEEKATTRTRRNWWSARLLLIASGVLLAIVQLAIVQLSEAQTGKFTATGKAVALLAETKMLPGDKAGHELIMVRRMDTISYSDPMFSSGQAVVASVADYTTGSGVHPRLLRRDPSDR